MARQAIQVEGLSDVVRAFGRLDADLKRGLQREISAAAKIVSADARMRAGQFGGTVAGKIQPRVRGASGFVESRARSKHVRPNFGGLLMRRVLLPAATSKEPEVIHHIEGMLDRLASGNGF